MSTTPITKRRKHYRAGAHVWSLVRDGYEKGYPVVLLAAHFGAGRTTIHKRARGEGWRRPGAPEVAPLPALRHTQRTTEGGGSPQPGWKAPAPVFGDLPDVDGADPPQTLADAIEAVIRMTVEAVTPDRAASASAFALLAERLMRLEARRGGGVAEPPFTPARDIIAVLAERFGVEPRP